MIDLIHQIWIGPKAMPLTWMDSWRKKNPSMDYNLWTSYDGFRYEDKIQRFVEEKRYSIAADIMRVEILEKVGGVYIDADSVCVKPIQKAPFMKSDFFAAWDYTGWVANGVIGCTPHHPIMKEYLEKMDDKQEYWEYGARLLTECIEGKEALILPTCTFYPVSQKGKKAPVIDKIYAKQFWATTKGLYV